MADLFQPTLSQPSPSGYIQQGVTDTSTAETIQALGKTGMEAWKGYEEAKLAGPDIIDTPEDISFADIKVDEAKGTAEVSPTTVLNLNKIAAGRKQGKISAAAARILVTSAVKEASARMPGMAEEFRRQAADFFGAYAPGWGLLEDEVAQKSAEEKRQEAQDKQMLEIAKDSGGEIYATSYMLHGSPEERERWVSSFMNSPDVKMKAMSSRYSTMLSGQESLGKLDKPRQNAVAPMFVADKADKVEADITNEIRSVGFNRINDLNNISDPGKRADAKLALQRWRAKTLSEYNQSFTEADPANRQALSGLLDGVVTKLEWAIDGKAKDEAAEDAIKAYKRMAFWSFEKSMPGTSLYFNGLSQHAPGLLSSNSPVTALISSKIGDEAARVFERNFKYMDINAPANIYGGHLSPESKDTVIGIAGDAVNRIETGPKVEGWEKSELEMLTLITKGMENPANRAEISQDDYKKIFNIYTKPEWKALKKSNPGLAEEIENRLADGIDDYAVRAGKSLAVWASNNPDLAKKVEIGVTSDGRMMFIPATSVPVSSQEYKNIKSEADTLNKKYQFGTMAQAWSNIYQRPQSELLKELAGKGYFPMLKMRSIE